MTEPSEVAKAAAGKIRLAISYELNIIKKLPLEESPEFIIQRLLDERDAEIKRLNTKVKNLMQTIHEIKTVRQRTRKRLIAENERLKQQLAEATNEKPAYPPPYENMLHANTSVGEPTIVEPPYHCSCCGVGLFESGDLLNGLCLNCRGD